MLVEAAEQDWCVAGAGGDQVRQLAHDDTDEIDALTFVDNTRRDGRVQCVEGRQPALQRKSVAAKMVVDDDEDTQALKSDSNTDVESQNIKVVYGFNVT